ncbi:P-loop NTPase fold protein [Pedobacter antarcticus]|uniref:P-loop NTPase fold protein n=1 Tax=Pedobacter antarcticus TaxID=34086 RepID=UPI0029307794|nr:P-loop NTPase fold protein [Pedobacter antarcticus]
MPQQQIIIDISKSNNAKEFQGSALIHQNELSIAQSWVKERIASVDLEKSERLHETITILGSRGSGKTSFLLSLIKKFENSDIAIIDIIDPTLIEDKGHVFLNVIASIKKLVEHKLDEDECSPMDSSFHLKLSWESKLKRLAHGLPSIDGVGTGLNEQSWQDPEFIMDRGIMAISAARDLEKNFHLFLEEGLRILKKKAFMVVFDDIDIDFKKGWPVLETIRKYFTTSKLITIVSGELRLFSLGIRKNLNQDLQYAFDRYAKGDDYLEGIMTEMESQYLQKVLKAERRVILRTLGEKKGSSNFLNIKIRTNTGEDNIEHAYESLLLNFGIKNKYQSKAFCSFLLNLPLRTQIRLFALSEKRPTEKSIFGVEQAFISELFERRFEINKVLGNPNLLNIEILDLLTRERHLNEGYQLQPTSEKHVLNCCLAALSFTYSNIVKQNNSFLVFDYFIRIGYVRNLLSSLGYSDDAQDSQNSISPSVNSLIKFCGLKQDGILRDITGLVTAYLRGYLNFQGQGSAVWAGTIPLKALGDFQKDKRDNLVDRVDHVFQDVRGDLRILGLIPLTISKFSIKNERIPSYSIYTLLSTIAELLKMTDSNDDNNKDDEDILLKGLQELSQIRTYTMPEFSSKGLDQEEEYLWTEEESTGFETIGHGRLAREIMKWKKRFEYPIVAPYLLGKISTRFFYALDSIKPKADQGLGSIFHSQIVSFMNAVLIEDIKENLSFQQININNTVYSDNILINNLSKVKHAVDHYDLKFSRWILSCPLLTGYLDPNADKLLKALDDFCLREGRPFHYEASVFLSLQMVSLRGYTNKNHTGGNSFQKRMESIINALRSRNIPRDLFEIGSLAETRERNDAIRESLNDVFGNDDYTSTKIREVREYIKDNNIKW